ncbi:uncharacterized protein B0H18DRAFT_983761 [Fomitopsis serialis]|uniref:uncharacterized protein n=1 Tax=Fomitopsis serialis TaxID=139415 RepID=UPI002007722B|nr:uncharacterized protein B0H18DRAFT_983761 [Neoantrodia serialis]KAH9933451.1 hypothetical protein B0H18DRAFT_983761 [Neoantrodia serialis]
MEFRGNAQYSPSYPQAHPAYYGTKTETIIQTERSSSPFARMPSSPPFINEAPSPSPTLARTSSSIKVPRTLAQWTAEAQASTAEFRKNGSSTPFAWVYVEGHNIPPSAVIAGDERGKPLYVARTFFEGTLQIGKAGHHLRLGASIPLKAREVDVAAYEVLVAAMTPSRWVYQSTDSMTIIEKQMSDIGIGGASSILQRRLKEIKVVVIVDDSMSMEGQYWINAGEALADVAEMANAYEADGIDIYFLNDNHSLLDVKSKAAVRGLFQEVRPEGQTPTGQKLYEVLSRYIPKLKEPCAKPTSIIVITDGVPTDDPEMVIVDAARRLEANGIPSRQLGIQFVQIGDDPDATEALKELDDGLEQKHGIRDIVDTTVYNPNQPTFRTETLVKILHGAVHNALDNGANPIGAVLEFGNPF